MQKKYTFLLIEDSHEDSSNFEETIERLNKQEEDRQYALEVAKSYEEGIEKTTLISLFAAPQILNSLDGSRTFTPS